MANWVTVSYALTGEKAELLDIEKKIRLTEEDARNRMAETDGMGDVGYLARQLGSELTYGDLGSYWSAANDDFDALSWRTTADGEEYLHWIVKSKWCENPKMHEMIEGAYKTVKIYFKATSRDTDETNDKEGRYFVP